MMAHMLRCLFYLEAKHDLWLTSMHVPGVENGAADAISRDRLDMFFGLVPQAQQEPVLVPKELVWGLVVQRPWSSSDWTGWLASISMPPLPRQPDECMYAAGERRYRAFCNHIESYAGTWFTWQKGHHYPGRYWYGG